jgi:hypothetical protein
MVAPLGMVYEWSEVSGKDGGTEQGSWSHNSMLLTCNYQLNTNMADLQTFGHHSIALISTIQNHLFSKHLSKI